jgi:CHRD domain-containing protein
MSPIARRRGVSCNPRTGARLALVALACAAALTAFGSQAFALIIPIQATLTGAGEVPPNDSPGRGRMTGTFDTDTNTLTWTVTYSGLSGPVIAAHFHGPVSYLGLTPEENAPIQVGTPGNLTSPFHSIAQISADQAKDLKDGRWYFNVHTKKFPDGEIRGPVVRE